ncbi:MAG: hypothetical protein ACFE0Q_12545 [Anaerolineae bacterium]
MNQQDHRAREETLRLITEAVTAHPGGMTRTQIARAIERTKTPHLINLIESLVDTGVLRRQVKVFGNGVEGYIYHTQTTT